MRSSIAFISCITFFVNLGIVSAEDVLPDRFTPSGNNSSFRYEGLTYENYLKLARNMIGEARTDLSAEKRNAIIDANAPFELMPSETCGKGAKKPIRRGVLMVHGLTDSPYFTRALGNFFQQNCFLVRSILLPGHGTRPGDLLDVKWEDWLDAVKFGADSLASDVDELYLLGFSTGGALSVYQSLSDVRVKGVFLFSPALKVSPKAMLANWHEIYSWKFPKAKWLDILPDEDPYKYESFPKNAADQIHLLTNTVQRAIEGRTVDVPVFVALSEEDTTVVTSETKEFFTKLAVNPKSRMLLYAADKTTVSGVNTKTEILSSAFPDKKILSSAHTAIMLPPSDPHYGEQAKYANCVHYFGEKLDLYNACKSSSWQYSGELSDANLKKGVVRRLMYNPRYDEMLVKLKQFIGSLP